MVKKCEILLGSQVIDGFYVINPLEQGLKLEWAVRGYLCYPGFLVMFPDVERVYLRKDVFLGKKHLPVTAIFSYLNLLNK